MEINLTILLTATITALYQEGHFAEIKDSWTMVSVVRTQPLLLAMGMFSIAVLINKTIYKCTTLALLIHFAGIKFITLKMLNNPSL